MPKHRTGGKFIVTLHEEDPVKLLFCRSSINGRKMNNLARDEKTTSVEFRIAVKSIAPKMETFEAQNVHARRKHRGSRGIYRRVKSYKSH